LPLRSLPFSPIPPHSFLKTTVKKKSEFINSSQNERLSPSCIALSILLSFDGFGSISWQSICFFRLLYSFHIFFLRICNFFCLSTLVFEMHIWCIKIGFVLVLHFLNPLIKAFYSHNTICFSRDIVLTI
jgi:hypothetical protein